MTDARHLPFGRVLESDVRGWPPDRAMARQAYIALVRSRLAQLGWTQRDLAIRLHTSEAFISALLTQVAETMPRGSRTPSLSLATEIALQLWTRGEERELFREVVATAVSPNPSATTADSAGGMIRSGTVVEGVLADVRAFHDSATFARDPAVAPLAYHQLWEASSYAVSMISPSAHPAAFAEGLMLLHDAACILNRADIALLCAQRALVALKESSGDRRTRERVEWLKVNAALAETVALNNLGNPAAAAVVAQDIEEHSYGYQAERRFWALHVKTDRLSSLGRMVGGHRFSVSEAFSLYDQARAELNDSPLGGTLLDNAFARALIAHGEATSLKKAEHFVERGVQQARSSAELLGPLHRAILLRTAARYAFRTSGNSPEWRRLVAECRAIVDSARLSHQQSELDTEDAEIPRA